MTKLEKLVTRAMSLDTCMQKYRDEAHDGEYAVMYLHAMIEGRNWRWWLKKLTTKHTSMAKLAAKVTSCLMVVVLGPA